jgi:hypothetical protein
LEAAGAVAAFDHQRHSEWIFTAMEGSASFDLHQIAIGLFG